MQNQQQQGSQQNTQSAQSQQTTGPTQNITADANWHDFGGAVSSFKSPVGCEIEPLAGTFGRVRSLEPSDQQIEVSYNQG